MGSRRLGIIDTSVLVTAERRKHSVSEIIAQLRTALGDMRVGLSVITMMELAHGIERAKLPDQMVGRRLFLEDLTTKVKIYSVTPEIARLAGRISGQQTNRGITVPFGDLLIGATALHNDCALITGNVRHFEIIPGLVVIPQ